MLERMDWDVGKKGKVAEILVQDAMSSEDSCLESDGEAEGKKRVIKYEVRRLSWESRQLRKIKKKLNTKYRKGLSKRACNRILPREDADQNSNRNVPENFPEWAVQAELL